MQNGEKSWAGDFSRAWSFDNDGWGGESLKWDNTTYDDFPRVDFKSHIITGRFKPIK